MVQELALPSGRVLFEWQSLDHVAIAETHAAYTGHPLDYFHINSIDLSSRRRPARLGAQHVGRLQGQPRTGEVLWRLGGKRSDFAMGRGPCSRGSTTRAITATADQHLRRRRARRRSSRSRAALVICSSTARRAGTARAQVHPPAGPDRPSFMGNTQVLDNGNVVVGWGSEPYVTEFGPDGDDRLRREAAAAADRTTARCACRGRRCRRSRRRSPTARQAGSDGSRQVERRHGGRRLAAARRPRRRGARSCGEGAPHGLRDRHRGAAWCPLCPRHRAGRRRETFAPSSKTIRV